METIPKTIMCILISMAIIFLVNYISLSVLQQWRKRNNPYRPFVKGNTYYVNNTDPEASDDNPGTEALPFLTIRRAKKAATEPGDTIMIAPGFYDCSVKDMSGFITFRGEPTGSEPIVEAEKDYE